jgi:Glycosyl transferases group 1
VSRWAALEGRSIELLYRKDVKVTRAPIAGEILRGFGFDVRVVLEEDADLSAQRILFVGGNPLWYRRALSRVESLREPERPLVIVWHTEPLPMPRAAGLPREPLTLREMAKIVLRDRRTNDWWSNGRYLRGLAGRGIVTVLSVATGAYQAYLAEHGVESELVPVGYHADDGRLLGLERDIDVVFLGDYGIRRRRRILKALEREGVDVLVAGSHSPTKGYWGEARTELLNRTKILLNLPRLQGHLPDIRLIVGMANGALVVSEPLYLPAPFVPGVHYIESPADELAGTLRRCLADDEGRKRISLAAYELVTQGLTLEESFERLLDLTAVRLGGDGSA